MLVGHPEGKDDKTNACPVAVLGRAQVTDLTEAATGQEESATQNIVGQDDISATQNKRNTVGQEKFPPPRADEKKKWDRTKRPPLSTNDHPMRSWQITSTDQSQRRRFQKADSPMRQRYQQREETPGDVWTMGNSCPSSPTIVFFFPLVWHSTRFKATPH